MVQRFDLISSFFDRTLTISVTSAHEIEVFSKRLGKRADMGVNMLEDSLSLTFIFPKEELKSSQRYSYSRAFKVTETGRHLILQRETKKNNEMILLIKDLLSVDSVILHRAFLEDGKYSFSFLFNSSDTPHISDCVFRYRDQVGGLSLGYLGASEPFFSNSDENKSIMAAVIESEPPDTEMGNEKNPQGKEWLRMVKMSYGTESVDGVYLLNHGFGEARDKPETISGKMYSATTENEVLELLTRRFTNELVVTIDQIHLLQNGRFLVYFTLQNLFRSDFVRIFNEVRKEFPGWKLSLLLLQNLYEFIDSGSYKDLFRRDNRPESKF